MLAHRTPPFKPSDFPTIRALELAALIVYDRARRLRDTDIDWDGRLRESTRVACMLDPQGITAAWEYWPDMMAALTAKLDRRRNPTML